MRPFDFVAIAAAILVVGWFSIRAYAEAEEGSLVRIQSTAGEFVYPLDTGREIDVDGPLGPTHVEIRDGQVRVVASPCREKICIAGGWISRSGEWVACLPNRVFLRIEGGEESAVDAQTF